MPLPLRLSPDTRLFIVPAGLVRIMDRDLVLAGIARKMKDPETGKEWIDKRDESGRTIDVHALRTTFCAHLSKAGVTPRTAQAAMRHASIDLTMNTYTDPRLLDVAGAMEAGDPARFSVGRLRRRRMRAGNWQRRPCNSACTNF